MRISTSQMFRSGLSGMLEQQARLAKTQQQVASGKRILTPADDPVGTVRSLELSRALEKTQQYQRNANTLETRLRMEESILGDSVNVVQRVRELALQANNATQSNESRESIAAEIRQQLDSLVNYGNTRDSSGYYIFAGYQQENRPFSAAGGAVSYGGDAGQRLLQVGPEGRIADSDPGSEVFMNIRAGNGRFQVQVDGANQGDLVADAGSILDLSQFTGEPVTIEFTAPDQYRLVDEAGVVLGGGSYQSGDSISVAGMSVSLTGTPVSGDKLSLAAAPIKDVFSMLSDLASSLEASRTTAPQRAAQTNEINAVISNLDQALEHLVTKQAAVGARMQSLERQVDTNAGAELQLEEALGEINDLDYAEGISRMNQQLLSLQAAQQSFAKLQGLSLFNYL